MKKTLLLILICVLLLSFNSCGKSDNENTGKDNLTESTDSATKKNDTTTDSSLAADSSVSSDLLTTSSSEKNVEVFTKRLINAADGTKIDSLTVTKSSTSDNYNIYAIISWNRKHTPSDSQQIIKDYSDSFASSVDSKLGNVENLSIVWLVSKLNGTASITYEKTDGMLSLKEETYDKKFGIGSEETTGSALQASTDAAVNTTVPESVVSN
ncbi:hypothetical protein [Aminipila sp.]|uniref:hypothetical protein n=1 Tax=Aminipila sp. TaxID=2060095 RepID=UPI002899E55A|nr:hypothetical protein [Aminipila sp.]